MGVKDENAAFVRELVYGRSAIVLDQSKQYLIESRLDPLARARRISSTTMCESRSAANTSRPACARPSES